MNIKKSKNIYMKYGILMMVVGAIITIIGFGILGFDKTKLHTKEKNKWYQTVEYTSENGWNIGASFGK